jgi:hypothetical protein
MRSIRPYRGVSHRFQLLSQVADVSLQRALLGIRLARWRIVASSRDAARPAEPISSSRMSNSSEVASSIFLKCGFAGTGNPI